MLVALLALALAGPPATSLSITVWPQGRPRPAVHRTLRCDPAGGTLPRPAAACRRLRAAGSDPFAPTPPRTACTMIYGGPQEALVRGTVRGRRVWARLNRRDGCEISRWDRLAFLFAA